MNIPIETLKRYLMTSNPTDVGMTTLVYISRAVRLRQEADRMEQQERDYLEIKKWLDSLDKQEDIVM